MGIQAKMPKRTVCREIARSVLTGETRHFVTMALALMRPTDIGVPHQPVRRRLGRYLRCELALSSRSECARGDQTMLPRVFALLLLDSRRIIVAPLARYAAVVGR